MTTADRTARTARDARPQESPADPDRVFAVHSLLAAAGLVLATFLLKSLIFEPLALWPVSFVCLAPWAVMVGWSARARRVYWLSFALGVGFFLWNMRWLIPATGLGYAALAVYLSLYFPLMVWTIRHALRHRSLPASLVLAIVWTGCEFVRAVAFSGFPWFFLSHSFAGVPLLIQVSDLVGAYGVSFVAAGVNGLAVDAIVAWAARRSGPPAPRSVARNLRIDLVFCGAALAFLVGYGLVQMNRGTTSDGPKVAVLQGDFVSTVGTPTESEEQKRASYFEMLHAAAEEQPDLYALPESPWWMYLNPARRDLVPLWRSSFDALRGHAVRHNATLVTGCGTWEQHPHDLLAKDRRYNSAAVFTPDGAEPQFYNKVHLVYFGEIVPFRFGPLRFLYFWLNRFMPFSEGGKIEFSYFPGETFRRFEFAAPSQGGMRYRFGVPICYEDVMPYVSRRFVSGGAPTKQVDFLLNISNDGWFGRGIQQPQHLAICVFRAVENRVGIARAVNTGESAFILPSGRIAEVVRGDPDGRWPGKIGYAVRNLAVDGRYTLYSRYGDWFACACAICWLALGIDYLVCRASSPPRT
jgi:apolipoprotein N-acyltransferase